MAARAHRGRSAWRIHAAIAASACLALVAGAGVAAAAKLPNACTLLTNAHPEAAFGHGKMLHVEHRKAQNYGTGKYASVYCSETVGTQPVSISISEAVGGSGGVKITSQTHPSGLGSDATLTVGVGAGNNAPVDYVVFKRGTYYVDLSANGASPATITILAKHVYGQLP